MKQSGRTAFNFVFFKHIDSASLADAGPQLQKVLDFRKSLEESRQVLYHGFANEAEFKAEVDRRRRNRRELFATLDGRQLQTLEHVRRQVSLFSRLP
ncbi:MAG: hypothetical protein NT013_26865 [Planctomycetia bacterium]|nr:hypothetical protein [Planctomycetia bacterium]